MIFRGGVNPLERLCSLVTVVAWWCGLFVIAALGTFAIVIVRMRSRIFTDGRFENWLLVGLLGVLFLRYVSLSRP